MDEEGFGLIAIIALAIGGLIVLLAAIGGIMYAADIPIGATVIDKECGGTGGVLGGGGSQSEVTVKTRFPIPGIDHTLTGMDNGVCRALTAGDNGNYAEYYLQSERTILYRTQGGECLYDSSNAVPCGS